MKNFFVESCHKFLARAYNEVKIKFQKIFRRSIKMKDEKILQNELMNEEELDQVAGGYNQENIEGVLNALHNMSNNLVEAMHFSAGEKDDVVCGWKNFQ